MRSRNSLCIFHDRMPFIKRRHPRCKKCQWIRPVQKVFPFKFIFPLLGWFCLKQVVIWLEIFFTNRTYLVPSSCGSLSAKSHTPSSIEWKTNFQHLDLHVDSRGRGTETMETSGRLSWDTLSDMDLKSVFWGSCEVSHFEAFETYGRSRYGCFRKWWYPKIIHFNRVFHYKPSILGYPYFWKHPYSRSKIALPFNLTTILTSMFRKWFVAATFWALETAGQRKAQHFRKGSSFFSFWTFFSFDLVVWRDLPIFFAS